MPKLTHKSDAGAVIIDIGGIDDLAAAGQNAFRTVPESSR